MLCIDSVNPHPLDFWAVMMNLSDADGFDWDEGNRDKIQQRMDVKTAQAAFSGEPLIFPDQRHSQDELRWFLMNRVGQRFVFLVFTLRGKKIRIISGRYMHDREVRKYGKKIG